MSSEEKSKLLGSSEPKNFYFLQTRKSLEGINGSPKIGKEKVELTALPQNQVSEGNDNSKNANTESSGIFSNMLGLFQSKKHAYQPIASKPRKVPIKVEPKVFFANERTFLAWLHMSVTLASISVAIVAFAEANEWSQMYGLLLMPVAIAFCVYSLTMYIKRAAMIRRKDPGPYEDTLGPTLLASMLGLAILVNFFVKLYDMAT